MVDRTDDSHKNAGSDSKPPTEIGRFIEESGFYVEKIQRARDPNTPSVDVETQKKIGETIPLLLTHMCYGGIPLNPPETDNNFAQNANLANLTPEQAATALSGWLPEEPPHITEVLKPENINTTEGQAFIESLKDRPANKLFREFGNRLWIKLVHKTMTERKPLHKIHPFNTLHEYNNLVVGLQKNHKYDSYSKILERIREGRSVYSSNEEDLFALWEYELNNDLFTDEDKREIEKLLTTDENLIKAFYKTTRLLFCILTLIPLTSTLIEKLGIMPEGVEYILTDKLAKNELDPETIKTIVAFTKNPENTLLIEFVNAHPIISEVIAEQTREQATEAATPETNNFMEERMRERARKQAGEFIKAATKQAKDFARKRVPDDDSSDYEESDYTFETLN